MTQEATWRFDNYSPEDFAEVGAVVVKDLTSHTVDWVRKKTRGIPTQENMRINVEKFRRILSIELAEKSRENVLATIEVLQQRKDIHEASPSYYQRIQSVSANDTYRNDQWGINNAAINEAWHLSTGNSTVIVGVLDSGIDGGHPDLTNRIHRGSPHNNSNTLHRDFTTGAVNGTVVLNPADPNGHGTHVGGIIGAQGNNGTGVVGVAWDIRLVSLRVFNANGAATTHDWLINAINYAASIDIPILNYSGGGTNRDNRVRDAIDAYDGLFVTAAGNSQNDNDGSRSNFPATFRLDNLVSVGSINSSNERSWFSNWGDTTVDIWAPGSHIYSTFPTALCNAGNCDDPNNEHIHRANGYHSMSGTSMASPHVAGVAALMLSANPNLTSQQLRANLLNNSSTLTITVPDPGFWPWQWNDTRQTNVRRLNAYAAVSAGATFDTRVLSDTTIEVRGTFDRQLSGSVTIPEMLNGRTVTQIGNSAFENQTQLTQISIPESVTSIGSSAFKNCTNLSNVTLPDNLTSIGGSAFKGCTSLSSINIPNNVTHIFSSAFENCTSLSNITLSNNLTTVHSSTFKGCTSLSGIIMPDSVTHIYFNAFENCTGLTNVALPDNLTSIGGSAFKGCASLESITIPNSVTYIGERAFENCTSLTSISLSNNLTTINSLTFKGCTSLESITIPNSVTTINYSAFENCTNLESVILSNALTSIGSSVFYGCANLNNLVIPASVTSISGGAFYGCSSLTNIIREFNIYAISSNYYFLTIQNIGNAIVKIDGVIISSVNNFEVIYLSSGNHIITVEATVISEILSTPIIDVAISQTNTLYLDFNNPLNFFIYQNIFNDYYSVQIGVMIDGDYYYTYTFYNYVFYSDWSHPEGSFNIHIYTGGITVGGDLGLEFERVEMWFVMGKYFS